MGDEATNRGAFAIQHGYCVAMDAPITATVQAAIADALDRDTAIGRRILDWPGEPTADALPLRITGGLHALAQAGEDEGMVRLFAGGVRDADEAAALVRAAFVAHGDTLAPWLDGPPQTNEAARSGAFVTGLIELARRYGHPLEILEIGSSAGFNLLIDRFRFDLGGAVTGPKDASVTIRPEWRGAAPERFDLRFASVRGVEITPLNVRDPETARRLRGYVWADAPERLDRLDKAIAMIAQQPVALEEGDAADWVAKRLAEPQAAGVTRVLVHSVVWQYLGAERQARIAAAMEAAGARADADRPLGWVRMEPDRGLQPSMEVMVRSWPDAPEWQLVARSQAHGAWVEPVA